MACEEASASGRSISDRKTSARSQLKTRRDRLSWECYLRFIARASTQMHLPCRYPKVTSEAPQKEECATRRRNPTLQLRAYFMNTALTPAGGGRMSGLCVGFVNVFSSLVRNGDDVCVCGPITLVTGLCKPRNTQ